MSFVDHRWSAGIGGSLLMASNESFSEDCTGPPPSAVGSHSYLFRLHLPISLEIMPA